ncbi:EI24 domain-containing protein [Campylobacter sp. RM16187]|uniref:EI24 domain-containing protein n=1 Tax=Campylobacter sp. RM16187 TaxID=1660063 RepID=UPI0021B58015|nr:EI24 domain-containing protein [Campylobacter sp. RM16187]QKG30028.1 putative membrane protein (EI24 domain) [Campylobacter sp. RM16187]
MIRNFNLAVKDFLTAKFLLLSSLPLVLSIIILGALMIFGGKEIYTALSMGAASGDFSFLDENAHPYIAQILSYGVTKWIVSALFYLTGTFFVLILSVFIALIVAGFLTPVVTEEINKRHYKLPKFETISLARSLKLMAIAIGKFSLLFLISLPLLFVPVLNLFIINVPFFYLYYSLLFIDIGSNTLSKNRFEIALLDMGGYEYKFTALIFYLLCLIPLVGLFLQIFFVIYFSHFFFQKEQIRV